MDFLKLLLVALPSLGSHHKRLTPPDFICSAYKVGQTSLLSRPPGYSKLPVFLPTSLPGEGLVVTNLLGPRSAHDQHPACQPPRPVPESPGKSNVHRRSRLVLCLGPPSPLTGVWNKPTQSACTRWTRPSQRLEWESQKWPRVSGRTAWTPHLTRLGHSCKGRGVS